MCKYCDKLKTKLDDDWIESVIDEDLNSKRKLLLMKYGEDSYGIMFDSDRDCFDTEINYCPICGRKLADNRNE